MESIVQDNLYKQAKAWVMEAGEFIRQKINEPLTVETKSNRNDLVTSMDKEIEYFFTQKIKETFKNHLIISEEGYGDQVTSMDGVIWIIDPIDGTMNFVHQKRNFAISLGIYCDGVGEIGLVYDVMSDILYSGLKNKGAFKNGVLLAPLQKDLQLEESILGFNHLWLCENKIIDQTVMQKLVKKVRGTRAVGSAALEFAYVAEGVIDGYMAMSLAPWDVAAGIVIVNEVGGVTTDLNGNRINLLTKNPIITSNNRIHRPILDNYLQVGRK